MDKSIMKEKLVNIQARAKAGSREAGSIGLQGIGKAASQTVDYTKWLIAQLDSPDPEAARHAEEKALELIEAWED